MFLLIVLFLILPLCHTPANAQNADFDGSGTVDFTDFLLFAQNFGSNEPQFDLDGNGAVDFTDFLTCMQAFLIDNPPPPPSMSVSTTDLSFGDIETGQRGHHRLVFINQL